MTTGWQNSAVRLARVRVFACAAAADGVAHLVERHVRMRGRTTATATRIARPCREVRRERVLFCAMSICESRRWQTVYAT